MGLLAEGCSGSWEAPATGMGQGLGLPRPPQATHSSLFPWRLLLLQEWEHPAGEGQGAASRLS